MPLLDLNGDQFHYHVDDFADPWRQAHPERLRSGLFRRRDTHSDAGSPGSFGSLWCGRRLKAARPALA